MIASGARDGTRRDETTRLISRPRRSPLLCSCSCSCASIRSPSAPHVSRLGIRLPVGARGSRAGCSPVARACCALASCVLRGAQVAHSGPRRSLVAHFSPEETARRACAILRRTCKSTVAETRGDRADASESDADACASSHALYEALSLGRQGRTRDSLRTLRSTSGDRSLFPTSFSMPRLSSWRGSRAHATSMLPTGPDETFDACAKRVVSPLSALSSTVQ